MGLIMAGSRRYRKIAFQKRIIQTEVIIKPHAMQRYCERILGAVPEGSDKEISTRISKEIAALMKNGRYFAIAQQSSLVIKSGFYNGNGELVEVYLLLRFKRNSEIEIVTVFNRQIAEEYYITEGKWIIFPKKKSKRQRRQEIIADCKREGK